jgi:hypothetical protein
MVVGCIEENIKDIIGEINALNTYNHSFQF